MTLILLHSSPAHIPTFDALRDRLAPDLALDHRVREDWLTEARSEVPSPSLTADITAEIHSADGPVLCTCTTLGEIAAEAGALRIDAPMMAEAASVGGAVLMAYALDSTRAPSLTLLQDAMDAAQNNAPIHPLGLTRHWPLFEAGDTSGFAQAIADDIRRHYAALPFSSVIVLAQASMAPAAEMLADLPIPVLTSPETAFRAALARL